MNDKAKIYALRAEFLGVYNLLKSPSAPDYRINEAARKIDHVLALTADAAEQAAPAAPVADTGAAYQDCCDTPHLCSAVRRCTAKDSAPASPAPTADSAADVEVWWKRIGCMRNPGAHTGEESARDAEIAELRAIIKAMSTNTGEDEG